MHTLSLNFGKNLGGHYNPDQTGVVPNNEEVSKVLGGKQTKLQSNGIHLSVICWMWLP